MRMEMTMMIMMKMIISAATVLGDLWGVRSRLEEQLRKDG